MRVFWYNGALMIEPENEREGKLLTELAGNIKFGRSEEMQSRISSGNASSGEELLDRLVGDHKGIPSSTSHRHYKKHIVAIDKPL